MIEVFEVTYENTEGNVTRRYKNVEEIMEDFGLTKREVLSFYTTMKTPKIDCVVRKISKIREAEAEEKEISNYLVVFD
jgi:hypothetical protein